MRGWTHLGHPFWRDEGAGLDARQPRLGQALNQVQLDGQRDGLVLILQAVAGADLDNLDVVVAAWLGWGGAIGGRGGGRGKASGGAGDDALGPKVGEGTGEEGEPRHLVRGGLLTHGREGDGCCGECWRTGKRRRSNGHWQPGGRGLTSHSVGIERTNPAGRGLFVSAGPFRKQPRNN